MSWLADLGDDLVIEFVAKDDPMVKMLLLDKIDNYEDWERGAFEAALESRYAVVERLELESRTRFLYLARKRTLRAQPSHDSA